MLKDALEILVEALEDVGIPAAYDPRDIRTPGAFISPERIKFTRLNNAYLFSGEIYLLSPDNGKAVDVLEELLSKFIRCSVFSYQLEYEAMALQLINHSPDPLPAIRIPITINMEISQND